MDELESNKQYLINNVNNLSHKDRISILTIFMGIPNEKIKTHTDGTRINLDTLPEEYHGIINDASRLTRYKLDSQNY